MEPSTWLIVFALGRIVLIPVVPEVLFAIEFLRTLVEPPGAALLVLSRLAPLCLDGGNAVKCSFCWCLKSKSRLAKHRVHSGQAKGFSFVWERSCRFKCSRRAKDRPHVAQTWGLGLSVFGGGKLGFMFWPLFKDFACRRARTSSVPKMLSFIERKQGRFGDGQDLPLSCPPTSLLPSALVGPPEAPTLVDGAIVFGSWAVVISESVVMTIQNVARNDWTDSFRRIEANTRSREPTVRENRTLRLLGRQYATTMAASPIFQRRTGIIYCGMG